MMCEHCYQHSDDFDWADCVCLQVYLISISYFSIVATTVVMMWEHCYQHSDDVDEDNDDDDDDDDDDDSDISLLPMYMMMMIMMMMMTVALMPLQQPLTFW